MEPKTIMVGIEQKGEDARDAVALGVALARAYEAPLVLTGVYPSMVAPGAHGYADVMREPTEAELQTARAFVPDDVDALVRAIGSTSPVRGLHTLAEELDARILVLGPSRAGTVSRVLGSDVTTGLLRAAPCAVGIADEGLAAASWSPTTIGVAYVATPEGREALAEGIDVAQRVGGTLRILNVPDAWELAPDLDTPLKDVLVQQAAHDLQAALDVVGGRVPAETVALDGDPVEQLLDATKDLDLLVMGSRAYGPLRRVLTGSVSSQVVHGASCPVLVLPRGAGAVEH